MSEIIKAEGIVVSIIFKCPCCGKINILNHSTMPLTSIMVNDEVELYYIELCHYCSKEVKVGIVATSD